MWQERQGQILEIDHIGLLKVTEDCEKRSSPRPARPGCWGCVAPTCVRENPLFACLDHNVL